MSEVERELRRENELLRARLAEALRAAEARTTTERLAERDAIFRAVFDRALDAMLLADGERRYVDANPAACELFGVPRDELIGQRPDAFIKRSAHSAWAAFIADTHGARAHVTLRRADGTLRAVEGTTVSDIVPGLHLAILRDVTARENAVLAVMKSEARFRALIDKSAEGIALLRADGTCVYMSPSVHRVLGTDAAEMVGRSFYEWVLGDDRAVLRDCVAGLVRDPSASATIEIRARHGDGSPRSLELTATNLLGDEAVAAIVANFRDVTERRRATEALARSEQRHRAIVELTPEPVVVHVGSTIVYANDSTARVLGLTSGAELIGHSLTEFVAPESRAAVDEQYRAAAALPPEQHSVPRTRRMLARDGREIVVEVTSSPLLYDDQHAVMTVARDVSAAHAAQRERERLIASLEFERSRLGTLLAKAPSFMAVLRGDQLVFDLVNEAYCAFVGRTDLVDRAMEEVLPETRAQGYAQLLREVLATGEPFVGHAVPFELGRSTTGRDRRFVDLVAQAVVEADGSRSGVFVHGIDVTRDTLAKRRIHAQFNWIPVPTCAWEAVDDGADFVLADYNEAASTITHGRIKERLGERASAFFEGDSSIVSDLRRCFEERHTIHREMEHTLVTTGERRHLQVTYAFAGPNVVIAHTQDVSERRVFEEKLRQAQKMEAVGRLAGGIAHDFNNLLSVILSYTELLTEELDETDSKRGDVEQIQVAGRRAVELTRQLLAFSRQQVLQPRLLRLDEAVSGMERMLRRVLGEDVELLLSTTPDLAPIHADPGQIEQVLMNLVVNARDAMPNGGVLRIRTANVELDASSLLEHDGAKPGKYVVLTVEDDGIGMDAATKSRVFEPFFTTKGAGKGTGLGLATVFGVVRQSGGIVTVDTEQNAGTTFRVYLPQASTITPPVSPPQQTRTGSPRGSETILLVEDEEAVRVVLRATLSRAGYEVIDAPDGVEAARLAASFGRTIHVLLTDAVMPRMSGPQLAELLTRERPEMKVLLMSGYGDDGIVRSGAHQAGMPFLQKPVTPDAVLREVRALLDEASGPRPTP